MTPQPTDFDAFAERVGSRAHSARMFSDDGEVWLARAPGRLDVLGGIADYSGSTVLEMPTAEAACVAVQWQKERAITIRSRLGATGADREFHAPLAEFEAEALHSYADISARFARDPSSRWAAYIAGTVMVLERECGVEVPGGVRILVDSNVPEGAGVASSAAIEVATMRALARALALDLEPAELARLCQIVENRVVGAPCGIMDQMTVACGRADHLLALRCQPAEIDGHIRMPRGLALWGIHSGVRHEVTGDDYTGVRCAAFMGRRILSAGAVSDGPLANLSPELFARELARHLPETMDGASFVRDYGGTVDDVTTVDVGRVYRVREATAFPVFENARVRSALALATAGDAEAGERIGSLLDESHAGYSRCGLGSAATDRLAAMVREQRARGTGHSARLHGARVSGGGSGGTVIVIGDAGAETEALIRELVAEYERSTGHVSYIFRGSSPGAHEVPVRRS